MNKTVESQRRPSKILIADDDPAILRFLADHCATMGFLIETATNGVQLLVKLRHCDPDILIADINMPELDGLSVCTHLLRFGYTPIELILITGRNDAETAARCESLGIDFRRKGPDLWKNIEAALSVIALDMDNRWVEPSAPSSDVAAAGSSRVLVVNDDPAINAQIAGRGRPGRT